MDSRTTSEILAWVQDRKKGSRGEKEGPDEAGRDQLTKRP